MNLFELIIDDEITDGIFAMSLVSDPAIEAHGMFFHKGEVEFKEIKEEGLFVAPILIPNKKILRVDGENKPYEVFFTPQTVKRLSQLYLEKKYQDSVTLEHDSKVDGVVMVESWIKESSTADKSNLYGLDVPVGSWLGTFKIDSEEIKQKFRTGEVSAISIEGIFEHVQAKLSTQEVMLEKELDEMSEEDAQEFLEVLRNLIFGGEEIELESYADYGEGIKNNAKRGIELNEKNGNKCATQTGKVRAQQLANGEAISVDTIKRMHSYLSRAETYYDESDTSKCGTISYLLWGGKAALGWSRNKLKELGLLEENEQPSIDSSYPGEKEEDMITPNPCYDGYIAIGTKIKNGKEVPNCVPKD